MKQNLESKVLKEGYRTIIDVSEYALYIKGKSQWALYDKKKNKIYYTPFLPEAKISEIRERKR